MKTWKIHPFLGGGLYLSLTMMAGTLSAQPYIDGDDPGVSAEGGAEEVVSGNPLDSGDRIYVFGLSYRQSSGRMGYEIRYGHAEPTSGFVQSLGVDAELHLVDFSFAWYLNYPPKIDRECGGRSVDEKGLRPWHCGRRVKPEFLAFAGPGWARLDVDGALPGSPGFSEDFLTLNAGIAAKLFWLRTTSTELEPGVAYDARRTSRWYLRPEIRARWFDDGNGEIDWSVGLLLGYSFSGRDTDGALCLQVEEACYLSEKILEEVRGAGRDSEGDALYAALEARRDQLQEYRARAREAGIDCGVCLDRGIEAVNTGLDKLR